MYFKKLLPFVFGVLLVVGIVGCTDTGVDPESTTTADNAFSDAEALRGFLGKLYTGLSLSGQAGGAGDPDLAQIDEGFSQYVRLWWQMQELTTDEAVIAWNDEGVQELNTHTWGTDNPFSSAMFSRIFFQVAQANEFLRRTTPQALDQAGIQGQVRRQVPQWRAEARFLRALSYWHGLDLFGKTPLVTEEDPIGSGEGETAPEMSTADSIFAFVESELRAISDSEGEENLAPPQAAQYGRADQAAAWMVLSKLFLNAEVYIGESRFDDAVTFSNRVINAFGANQGALEDDYHDLFLADNDQARGIIFPVPQDGDNSRSFGNTTFLVNASTGGSLTPEVFGVPSGGWLGIRTTPETVARYEEDPADTRPVFENMSEIAGQQEGTQFFREARTREVESITEFENGFGAPKYQNITSDGMRGADGTFPDTDFPMFRLAEAYLTYAEAKLRGGGGGDFDPLNLVNLLRERAEAEEITNGELTLDFILDERSRELFWEATRRTDLRRFEQFVGDEFLWSWKGGQRTGTAPNPRVDLFPIPESEILANPNITQDDQNPGY